ncbi:MAG: NAD-dependent epimerase/dehydratase family protein [Flavobacteriales bacterium]|nr:NAD-dependent epimerase/dehydratase family protein [Flavobacteriales bacterium]
MELVTGGTGIVGAHVLLELAATGRSVRALQRPGTDVSVVERIFTHYRPDAKTLLEHIHWVPGDILDMPSLADAMVGVTHVYHAAAMVSFDPRDARHMQKVNVEGTANVVNAALVAGVRRLCHVSSVASIGEGRKGEPRHEGLQWQADGNTSTYALSKYEAEMEVVRGIAEGLDAVMVNPCVVLGPGIPGRSSMTLVERLAKGTRFFPAGSNAVVDARDVASAMVTLMEQGASGERYILAGENLGYKELFGLLAKAFGRPEPSYPLPAWALQLAWRAERIRTTLFGGRAFVTRSTVHTALSQKSYDASKAQRAGIAFRTAEQAVANVAAFVRASAAC